MSSKISIYRYGIHRGEEALVVGNSAAGMINFSGCHLSCGFCYTPETSVQKLGINLSTNEFQGVLRHLKKCGAKNINLISPSHLWRQIEFSLLEFKSELLPLVLKTSGYESPKLISRMAKVSDVFVPDFKVWDPDRAREVGLPSNYGEVALSALLRALETHTPRWSESGQLTRGILLRHLLMPGFLSDSCDIIERLNSISFQGALNIMTRFIDPLTQKLVRAPANDVELLSSLPRGYRLLVNGKEYDTRKEVACA